MHYKTHLIHLLGIAVTSIFWSCESEEPTSFSGDVEKSNESTSAGSRIGAKEKITINTNDFTTLAQNALSGRTSLTIDEVFARNQAILTGTRSATTELVVLEKFKFDANDQKGTRRPQGVGNYGKYVINSWYFTSSSTWDKNCKLTISDTYKGKYFNLVPVQFHSTQTTKFQRIESHAGGLTVIDNYLYIVSGSSILIFDINKIYKIIKETDPAVAIGQHFIYEYTYMVPQVGEIIFDTDSGAKASYLSLTEINSHPHFVIGNFYSTVDTLYDGGGRSMIWLLPVQNNPYPYPTIQTNVTREYTQLEPLFPSGPETNTTVTRIQGALVKDNVLTLNRSYSTETYQLIVMKYSDVLSESPTLTSYFSGSPSSKHNYDNKNWLFGCEDLEYYNGPGTLFS